ncbi:putative UDP-glucuronate:xylan alpha-glucuronosyltransferase 5 [Amaranthus tricolor]|uniref:putative UDP-glucuronate:xylan alpha-glucuronosyltransferase 5 n=1 Tax=Amaranthus tricolor TaxID=29722 RepID=UPI0025898760|nr:putative UDP-glucuronate:xylan alpha-glucuronosyltransferase 5 [Amaranthus tricolor]
MASIKPYSSTTKRKLIIFSLSFLIIFFPLVLLSTLFFSTPQFAYVEHLQIQPSSPHSNNVEPPKWLKVILESHIRPDQPLKVGLINFDDSEQSHLNNLGGSAQTVTINLKPVSSNITWENLFPEWIDETLPQGFCPEIPMPEPGRYSGLDVVVANLPCTEVKVEKNMKEGIRDVHRLQISLAIANLVVENGISNSQEKDVCVVFIGKCEPMIELFRCEDLILHKGDYWVYKPNLDKLKEMIKMPFGSCALPQLHAQTSGSRQLQGNEKIQSLTRAPITYKAKEAFVTILHSSEDYVCGAIALAHSIRRTNTTKDLVLLADHTISSHSILGLQAVGWKIKRIHRIKSPNAEADAYNKWNYSKLRIWQLVEYDKLMFIDSDFIVLRNIDHFFNYPQLSAAPNDKWIFNSGIMLLEPSKCFFDNLMAKRYNLKSYNGGDQGYLNEVITWWHRLTLHINFLKFFEKDDKDRLVPKDIYTIHLLGTKPWLCFRDYDCNWDREDYHPYASDDAHAKWWQVYDTMPKNLQTYCGMTRKQDRAMRNRKANATKVHLSNGHWKIHIKDPRQYNLI